MKVTFEKVTLRAQRRANCTKCGKKRTRTVTFWQTLNPFNKTAEGRVKTTDDIYPELRAQATAWTKQSFICASCEF